VPGLDLDAVAGVVAEFPVQVAVLYGSHARGDARAASDVDFAVGFETGLGSSERTEARLALVERLGAVLDTDAVDVIPLASAPPSLVEAVVADGVLLYGSPDDLAAYRDETGSPTSRAERLAEFDDILDSLERVV
jgi:predicted nucleotidyltransferase